MTTKEELAERELEVLHAEWEERRRERDNQATIRLANLVTWVAGVSVARP